MWLSISGGGRHKKNTGLQDRDKKQPHHYFMNHDPQRFSFLTKLTR
jgi:hypothetical protein